MNQNRWNNKSYFFIGITILIYIILTIISLNNSYFWDNIQQTSKEAHWFFQTNFSSLLMPPANSGSEIVATGYHPPLMGIMTAMLWKLFGYNLWVSHVFILLWAIILIYNLWKLILLFFKEKTAGWILLIVLLEPTVLTQFAIASPDFILFTAFIVSLRAVLQRKTVLLSVGLVFLCGINMRGIFAGVILFFVQCYQTYLLQNKRFLFRVFFKDILPFLPVILLLKIYFIYYLSQRVWFFANETSTDHYAFPTSVSRVVKHLAEFGLRTIENGRIIIWMLAFLGGYKILKNQSNIPLNSKVTLLLWFLLTGLYFIFVFISQMPFSARYFMPQFFLLTILVLSEVNKFMEKRQMTFVFVTVLIFELTGNLWIYPDKIAKSWDCTLAHLPYYELRQECFDYIDEQKMDYNYISAGFCLYGDRKFVELKNAGKIVGTDPVRKYFIYSNISNIEDSLFLDLQNKDHWMPLKEFKKGFVDITIFQKQ